MVAFIVLGSSLAHAQEATVRILVESTSWSNCADGPFGGPPEIYFVVSIGDTDLNSLGSPIESNFSPFAVDREFSASIDLSAGPIPVTIQQWDDDGFLLFDNDQCDISPSGNTLTLTLDPSACTISGDLAGVCDTTLTGSGGFNFRISVDEPAGAAGLQTRCMHSPVWPQAGETVTITASALDGSLASLTADEVEIWVDDQTAPGLAATTTDTLTFTAGPFAADTFNYGCRVVHAGQAVWTGWRTVAVGTSGVTASFNDRVPILFTGPRASRIDLVFYADRDSYTAPTDPAFISDVGAGILNAYFSQDVFLENQDVFNFWISLSLATAEADCETEASLRSWEDSGAVLHTDSFRDCAPGGERFFSTEPGMFGVMLHETGHRPFGLADEYCCDGGYFQADPFPNVYEEQESGLLSPLGCQEDAPNVGRAVSDCREWEETIDWWFDPDWYTSDPVSNDLMVDNQTRQALDNRRIEWLLGECRGADC